MLYRISTKDKNRFQVKAILKRHGLDCATLVFGEGLWQGTEERSLIIELDLPPIKQFAVYSAAKDIKLTNGQEKVLLQTFAVESELI